MSDYDRIVFELEVIGRHICGLRNDLARYVSEWICKDVDDDFVGGKLKGMTSLLNVRCQNILERSGLTRLSELNENRLLQERHCGVVQAEHIMEWKRRCMNRLTEEASRSSDGRTDGAA